LATDVASQVFAKRDAEQIGTRLSIESSSGSVGHQGQTLRPSFPGDKHKSARRRNAANELVAGVESPIPFWNTASAVKPRAAHEFKVGVGTDVFPYGPNK